MLKHFMLVALAVSVAGGAYADDWMAGISGNAYVNQLSIPGTHDCGTGNGFTGVLGTIGGPTMAQTQDLSMQEQWDCGVRAFDLRPAVSSKSLAIYHGVCQTKLSFKDAFSTLRDMLNAHPTEFAVVLMRHETDGDSGDSSWSDKVASELSEFSQYLVDYNPELTVDEVRGKIIVLSRDRFTNSATGFISGWSHSSEFSDQQGATIASSSARGRLYVQDYYDCTGTDGSTIKANAVKRMYEFSKTLCDPSADRIWVVNHTSGYTKSANSNANRELASVANAALLEQLNDQTVDAGPTGIVLMDFAGTDNSSNYQTRGLELVNALVAHNARYKMASTGEDIDPSLLIPTVATEDSIYWHVITSRRESKSLTCNEDAGTLVGQSVDVEDPSEISQWKIEQRDDLNYNIVNRANGLYINPDNTGFNQVVHLSAYEPNEGWSISKVDNNGYYAIHSGTAVQLNQTQAVYEYQVYNWFSTFPDKNDEGCMYRFRVVDSEEVIPPVIPDPDPSVLIEQIESESVNADQMFDLTGRKVKDTSRPGVYIVSGHKIVVR